ncbi:MAG: SLC13 family permease [Gallionellaceae bacterium]|nr:SLC13 family permease [Gallionellaceae bacterium]
MADANALTALGFHGIAVLAVTVLVFGLYIWDRYAITSVSFALLATLVLLFSLFPYAPGGVPFDPFAFFMGFGHPALVAICALMILGHALVVTGALSPLTRKLSALFERHPRLALVGIIVSPALASGFVNDTPIVVMLIPLIMGLSLSNGKVAGQILMPMNFAVLIGGMATTIGTSTNLIVVSLAADLGLRQIGMFDFYPMVALAAVPGLIYLGLVAPHLLRHVKPALPDREQAVFEAELLVDADSTALDKTLIEVLELTHRDMEVHRIVRGEGLELSRLPSTQLREGDRLVIRGTAAQLKEWEALLGADLHGVGDSSLQPTLAHPDNGPEPASETEEDILEQMIITQGSYLAGHTLRSTRFALLYDLIVVGIRRHGSTAQVRRADLADTRLSVGDVLLVQGPRERILDAQMHGVGLSLNSGITIPRRRYSTLAIVTLAAVVLVSALKIIPIGLAAVLGVGILVVAGCLRWDDITQALSVKVILLVVSSLALGLALTATGGTHFLAGLLIEAAAMLDTGWFIALLMLMMGILTNFVSNNAAAAVGTPIAIEVARLLGAPAEPFVLAVLFGCNLCYLTPMGYQTNLLVMNSAGYRFGDFVKVGAPLFLIMWAALSLILVRSYGL